MKKAFSGIFVSFLSLALLVACNQQESETQKELAALKEQLAQQQKQQTDRENQEQEHRKRLEQQERETALYEQAYQNAQEDLKMKQNLEEEQKKEEANKKKEEAQKQAAEKKKAVEGQQTKTSEKLARYPAFVISESGYGSLNLRGAPSASAISITQLRDGQQVQVVAITNNCNNANGGCWVKVQVDGLTGYVSDAYLQRGYSQDAIMDNFEH